VLPFRLLFVRIWSLRREGQLDYTPRRVNTVISVAMLVSPMDRLNGR
jgi:hypothetical protein